MAPVYPLSQHPPVKGSLYPWKPDIPQCPGHCFIETGRRLWPVRRNYVWEVLM